VYHNIKIIYDYWEQFFVLREQFVEECNSVTVTVTLLLLLDCLDGAYRVDARTLCMITETKNV